VKKAVSVESGRQTSPALFFVTIRRFQFQERRMQSENVDTQAPRSRRLWLSVPAIFLGCCAIGAAGAVIAWPSLRTVWQGLPDAPSIEATSGSPATDQSQDSSGVGSSSKTAAPGEGGLADPLLKSDVWKSIQDFYASNRTCTDVSSTAIEITQAPDSSGVWKEAWTVEACGETAVLNVEFTPSPKGGTDYHVTQ
jgi:hypothetical protein